MKIVAMPNGPLLLAETGRLVDEAGHDAPSPVYLCRCGASRHKPYCDGSHAAIGFRAAEAELKSVFKEDSSHEARQAH
jgi:CDGSH-type Zn-finger protein